MKNNKNITKIVVILLLICLIGTFTHCMPTTSNEIGDGGGVSRQTNTNVPNADEKDEGQVLQETQVTTGVRNHEQILQTMAAVTGIDPYTTPAILQVYRQVESSLPTENDIKLYTATQQVAITKLAAEFCFQLTTNNFASQRMVVWPTLNLNAVSGTAFNQANETAFINQTISAFWGDVLTQEELNMTGNEFRILIDQIINNENTAAATQRTVRGVCTAALSSAYVTLL